MSPSRSEVAPTIMSASRRPPMVPLATPTPLWPTSAQTLSFS
jgi:hypothetical protein